MPKRRATGLVVAGLLAFTAVLGQAAVTFATAPVGHETYVCHAVPPDTAAEGYIKLFVDVASVGYQQAGHESEHDADIIPAYSYTDSSQVLHTYDGKNWDSTGEAIWDNGCVVPGSSSTPFVTYEATNTPFESIQGETATPVSTTPPTSTTGDNRNDGPSPTGALLIALGFGGIGLFAVGAQRRKVRR
jgi:hypothetical protein